MAASSCGSDPAQEGAACLDSAALRHGKPGVANPPFVCKGRL